MASTHEKEVIDFNYEYDCPHFVDFNGGINDMTASSEDYFATDHEFVTNGDELFRPAEVELTPRPEEVKQKDQENESEEVDRNIAEAEAPTACEIEVKPATSVEVDQSKPLSNIVASRDAWNKMKATTGKNPSTNDRGALKQISGNTCGRTESRSPPHKKRMVRTSTSSQRENKVSIAEIPSVPDNNAADEAPSMATRKLPIIKHRLTTPKTPSFMKRMKSKRIAVAHVNMMNKRNAAQQLSIFQSESSDLNETKPMAYKSVAQQILEFANKTPKRFHKKSDRATPVTKGMSPQLTKPCSPNLVTKMRIRQNVVKSHEQLEEEELARIRQNQFKAQPINLKVLENPEVVHPVKHEPIVVEEFHFATKDRAEKRQDVTANESVYHFHANPLPRDILTKPAPVPEVPRPPLTVPESPAFILKNRKRTLPTEHQQPSQAAVVKRHSSSSSTRRSSSSVPHAGLPFQPKLESRTIEPEPFSFEERDKARLAAKQARIEQEIAAASKPHEFKAQPLPEFSVPDHLPTRMTHSPTRAQPFHFHTEERAQVRPATEPHNETVTFHARPATVLEKAPFVPEKPAPPVIDIQPFHFSTDERSERWAALEQERAERNMETEAMREARRKEAEEQQQEEERRLRQQLVHKANPIRRYRGIAIAPSDKHLTEAKSPNFSNRFTR